MKLGQIFGENISTTTVKQTRNYNSDAGDFKNRLFLFQTVLVICFAVIVFQLINLMVVKGDYYSNLANNNRTKENIYPSPRGIITDRKGEILVRNKPGFVALVDCQDTKCFRKITHDEALKLEVQGKASPLTMGVVREYINPSAFAHIIGTTGNVLKEEIGTNHCGRSLTYEDELGRSGVEKSFDCQLSGIFGREFVEIDAMGKPNRILSKLEPKPGESLTLSIDKKLQLKTEELMQGKKGAVIVHVPQTGEILVLYSSPSYDLSQFTEGMTQEEFNKLTNDPDKPLFNRAISGVYPPGSIFKTIIAAGALEERTLTKDTLIEDAGIIRIGDFSFSNWYFTQYGKTEGQINIVTALKRSNDIFFYKAEEGLGVEKIAKWAKKFKLGEELGIEITGEEPGLVPDPIWKEKVRGEKWYLGDTYHLGIGQGDLLVSPLQIAFANGAFANNGIICKPTILKRDSCQKLTDKLVSTKTLSIINEGLVEACSEGGTAYPFFNYKVKDQEIKVACKTGTAEIGDPKNNTHAWFTAFAPADKPQIMVTVFIEEGGEGSKVAAPIAKELFDTWFSS